MSRLSLRPLSVRRYAPLALAFFTAGLTGYLFGSPVHDTDRVHAADPGFQPIDEDIFQRRIALLGKSVTIDIGDLDGDGDMDALVGNIADCQGCMPANRVWLSDGAGDTEDSMQRIGTRSTWGVALGDLDGDGDLDAYHANTAGPSGDGANTVWLNDGSGVFTDSGQLLGSFQSQHVALGDIDGDGDLDAAVANLGLNTVWLNDGAGRFTDSGFRYSDKRSNATILVDMDEDGDLDLFVANTGLNHVFWNDSSGGAMRFTDSGMRLGLEHDGGDGPSSRDVSFGDVDGDGDLDAFVVNAGSYSRGGVFPGSTQNSLWLSEPDPTTPGRIRFVDSGRYMGEDFSFGVELGDLDDDGDLDAWVANSYLCGTPNKVWLNDGAGNFTDSSQRLGVGNGWDVRLLDLDGDADLDAWEVNYGPAPDAFCRTEEGEPNEVWINQGDATAMFVDRLEETSPGLHERGRRSMKVVLGDVTGDGKPDAIFANRGEEDPRPGETDPRTSAPNTVFYNNGVGWLTDSAQRLGNEDSRGVALGDVDGDGDLDLFVGNWAPLGGAPDEVWLNDGTGRFTDTGQRLGLWRSNDMHLVDLDADGDLDAFVASTAEDLVWLNDGTGRFTDTGQRLGEPHPGGLGPNSEDVDLVDLDGDGDLDAFTANSGSNPGENPNRVYLNNGSAGFSDTGQRLGNEYSFDAALADLDGDGDNDAIIANSSICGAPNEVWWNDGAGNFADSGQRLGTGNSMSVNLGDFDCDGDLDAFIGNVSVAIVDGFSCPASCPIARSNKVWLNDGTGVFSDSGLDVGNSTTISVAIADMDGDGDIDAVTANAGRCGLLNRVFLNECGNVPLATPTFTPMPTPVDPPTDTPTPADPPTVTPTPGDPAVTPTPGGPPTDTPTPSDPPTDTPTPSDAPTDTPTPSDPPTDTPTPSDAPTDTPTPSDLPTDTPTPSDPPTDTPTPSDPPTDTPTPSDPPTDTPTPSDPPTDTPTPVDPPTATPTAANTSTPGGPPPTGTPSPTATVDPGTLCICPEALRSVPPEVIEHARNNPHLYRDWMQRLDPGKPAGPFNPLKKCLSLKNPSIPYHPLFNGLVWKVNCTAQGCP